MSMYILTNGAESHHGDNFAELFAKCGRFKIDYDERKLYEKNGPMEVPFTRELMAYTDEWSRAEMFNDAVATAIKHLIRRRNWWMYRQMEA